MSLLAAALTSSLCNTGGFVTGHVRPNPRADEHVGSSDHALDESGVNQNESSWMSAAYSSTKVVIDVVKESSDVFPPLKSVANGLAVVLKHYDVRSLSLVPPMTLTIALASNNQ